MKSSNISVVEGVYLYFAFRVFVEEEFFCCCCVSETLSELREKEEKESIDLLFV